MIRSAARQIRPDDASPRRRRLPGSRPDGHVVARPVDSPRLSRRTLASPLGCCALVSAAVLLTWTEVLRGATRPAGRTMSLCWTAPCPAATAQATPPSSVAPPRPEGTVLHHGHKRAAISVVLIQQARRVNLSRLGGLQGP